MSVQSIQCLEAQVANLSMPVEKIKIPKISKSVRAIFEECAPELTDVSVQPYKKFRQEVPNLHLKVFEFRQEANKLYNDVAGKAALSLGEGVLAAAAVGALYNTVIGSLGIVGAGLSLIAGGAAIGYFVPKQSYTANWVYGNNVQNLATEIRNHKTFFTAENCKMIEQAIRAKLQQMNDKEVMKPKYDKALIQLKQNRGYIC